MSGQIREFLDGAGQLWSKGTRVGKMGGVFVNAATKHGGQPS
jgi:NAD(P)H dehydrogenase (quinone)